MTITTSGPTPVRTIGGVELVDRLAAIADPADFDTIADPVARFVETFAAVRDAEKHRDAIVEDANVNFEDLDKRRVAVEAQYRTELLRIEQSRAARAAREAGWSTRRLAGELEQRLGMVLSFQRISQIMQGTVHQRTVARNRKAAKKP